ncbi:MAG TPA: hypothetical protein V6C81_20105 [Planktothrix sp.]|jgi:hypothetical protein
MKLGILTIACTLSFLPMAGAMADETYTSTTIQQDAVPVVTPAPTTIIERTEPTPVVVPAPAPVIVQKKNHHLINLPFVHLL